MNRNCCRLVLGSLLLLLNASMQAIARPSFDALLECRKTIEDLRWSFTLWPTDNKSAKPTRATVLSDAEIGERIHAMWRKEAWLREHLGLVIDDRALQTELERMALNSRAPEQLAAMFDALGGDARQVAECVARPLLVERRLRDAHRGSDHERWWQDTASIPSTAQPEVQATAQLTLPRIAHQPATLAKSLADTWRAQSTPTARAGHAAIWTGHEMIIWGGHGITAAPGFRYYPSTDTWVAIATLAQPQPMTQPAVVWTGTEMLVWGGRENETPIGGRYNPQTDKWSPITPIDAPSPRYDLAAQWTGSELLIWGGYTTSGTQATGGRYDPQLDRWTPISVLGAPKNPHSMRSVWTGEELIVWGNCETPPCGTGTGGRYNPSTDVWVPISNAGAPTIRSYYSAVWTGEEMVIFGGCGPVQCPMADGAKYRPQSDSWTAVATHDARHSQAMVWTGAEMIIWGGYGANPEGGARLDAGGSRYDPAKNTWTRIRSEGAPDVRDQHSAVWTGSEMIVWGGNNGVDMQGRNSGGRYDPAQDTWVATPVGNPTQVRGGHTATWTGVEMVVWGGLAPGGFLLPGMRYQPDVDQWQPLSTTAAPNPRSYHTAVWTGSEVIVWGGFGIPDSAVGGRYNPQADLWSPVEQVNGPAARAVHAAIWTGSEMVVFGGADMNYGDVSGGALYDPVGNQWRTMSVAGAPTPRRGPDAVWTGSEMIVWGGYSNLNGPQANGGRYDPESNVWLPMTTLAAPASGWISSMVWTGSHAIVWGGAPSPGNGAKFDPATNLWQAISTVGAPQARYGHTAVWTGSDMLIWGGRASDGTLFRPATGAKYHPESDTWTPMSEQLAPAGREEHTAIWTGRQMVIFGGWGAADYGVYRPYLIDAVFADGME